MIFYFSATGNSLYVAQKVNEKLGGSLINIAGSVKNGEYTYNIADDEKVGLVLPVYFFGIPTIVSDFLSRITFAGNTAPSTFLILTCGSKTGGAGEQLEKLLNQRNVRLDYKFAIAMPDNYAILLPVPDKKKQERLFENADKGIESAIQKITNGKVGDYNKIKGFGSPARTLLLYPFYKYGRKTKKFYATDACTACGLCEKICPVGAIKVAGNRPKWVKEHCVHCLACLHRCPAKAVQYGKGTLKRGRYVHPKVKL